MRFLNGPTVENYWSTGGEKNQGVCYRHVLQFGSGSFSDF